MSEIKADSETLLSDKACEEKSKERSRYHDVVQAAYRLIESRPTSSKGYSGCQSCKRAETIGHEHVVKPEKGYEDWRQEREKHRIAAEQPGSKAGFGPLLDQC